MENLNYFIDTLDKDYSNFEAIEDHIPKGHIVVYYSSNDLQDLDAEQMKEFEKVIKQGFYYAPGTVLLNERFNLPEQKTIFDEIDFPELEYQFKEVAS